MAGPPAFRRCVGFASMNRPQFAWISSRCSCGVPSQRGGFRWRLALRAGLLTVSVIGARPLCGWRFCVPASRGGPWLRSPCSACSRGQPRIRGDCNVGSRSPRSSSLVPHRVHAAPVPPCGGPARLSGFARCSVGASFTPAPALVPLLRLRPPSASGWSRGRSPVLRRSRSRRRARPRCGFRVGKSYSVVIVA